MNKQRKVVITITYNEMGIIIDTKAEEVVQPNLQPTCNQLATDCISRQAVIDTDGLDEEIRCEMCKNPMHTDRGCDGNCKYDEKLYERIMQILDKRIKPLPSAQPERKRGEWINRSLNIIYPDWERYTCSACGKHAYNYDFCPNCGADMRGEQDG